MKHLSFLVVIALTVEMLLAFSFFFGLLPSNVAVSSDIEFKLTLAGLVEHPLNLTLADITAMPQTTIYAQLICVGPPSFVVTEGNWTGVRLQLLLEEAEVLPNAFKLAFYAQDGYTTDLHITTARRDDVILAYAKDGKPLNEVLRLVVPGKWGYKWISQLVRIEVVDYDFLGLWESKGYSDEADISLSEPKTSEPPLPRNVSPYLPPVNPPEDEPPPSPPRPYPNSTVPLQPSPSPEPSGGLFISAEVGYAIALVMIAILLATVVKVNRKKAKNRN